MKNTFIALTLLCSSLLTARAGTIELISIDTSALVGQGSYYADFQFTSPNGNNLVTLIKFNFDPGRVDTLPAPPGSFFSELLIPFTPGLTLTFQLDLETNPLVVKFPDELSFLLLDSAQNALPTSDPLGLNALFTIGLTAGGPTVSTFTGTGDLLQSEPVVQGTDGSAVPEPGSLSLFGLALAGGLLYRKRRMSFWSRPV